MENHASVKFFGFLKEYAMAEEPLQIIFSDKKTVRQILTEGHVPEEIVGFTTVNDQVVSRDYLLQDGDQVKIFPLIIGG